MTKPLTYEDAFPGRFLKAAHFKGQKVTLTIADVFTEALDGEDDEQDAKPPKLVLSFVGKKMQLVAPKTNAFCIKELFGNKLADWVGKRLTFYPTTTKFGGKMVDCIRIWGSPDITSDMQLVVPQGRKKPLKMTMHAMKAATKPETAPAPVTITEPDQALVEAWSALGWSREQGAEHLMEVSDRSPETNYLGLLGVMIDEMNAKEGTF